MGVAFSNKNELTNEISRLKKLQRSLKDDITRYKNFINNTSSRTCELSDKEKDALLENFHMRLKRNSWILKKILFQLKKNYS